MHLHLKLRLRLKLPQILHFYQTFEITANTLITAKLRLPQVE